MDLAILFLCHKGPDLCEGRVRMLRKYNPDSQIFALYGGNPMQSVLFQRQLSPYVNDFSEAASDPPTDIQNTPGILYRDHWKRRHVDLLITDWFLSRGRNLQWDTICVVQWDTLLFESVRTLCAGLKRDELLLSGLKPVADATDRWGRIQGDTYEEYQAFFEHMERRYGHDPGDGGLCFQSAFWCLPRSFLTRYARVERPSLGFYEYAIPAYAAAFGFSLHADSMLETGRFRSDGLDVWAPTIAWHLRRREGARMFHPYRHPAPGNGRGWMASSIGSSWRLIYSRLRRLGRRRERV